LLTGGIGTGKSSVGELLRARGALVIDADEVGHKVLEPEGAAFRLVAETWPAVVVDGLIDRKKLADIVFRDPAELERLESFTHLAIRQLIAETIESTPHQVVVVEVPLLTDFMGAGWLRVVVDVDPELRMERLQKRELDEQDVARRIAAQPERDEWTASAEVVLDNSGDVEALGRQVDSLWERLTNGSTAPQD
jgi:dephospho-CoA kinase